LGILTVLAAKNRADFSYLQTALDMTRGNLGKHLEALADASLIHVEKGYVDRRARTRISITKPGRRALAIEMSALRDLHHQYERPDSTRTPRDPCMCEHGALNSKSLIADGRPHPDRDRTWAGSGDIHRSST